MTRVLLIHGGIIPHYRLPIYSYLHRYLQRYNFELMVTSSGIQANSPDVIDFPFIQMHLMVQSIISLIVRKKISIIIDFMELKQLYLFPIYFLAKGFLRRRMVYWGQGRDILDSKNLIKNLAYAFEQSMCSAIILYAEHLRKYVPKRFHKKTFIANNTLLIDYQGFLPGITKDIILRKYNIHTKKNIICLGRLQKRKRVDHLLEAFLLMGRNDFGLILAGPDSEGVITNAKADNIFILGPLYGNEKFDLLSSMDLFCLPGAVGLSIVDAFFCGLPLITEEGYESAEIMYLKHGINGLIVPKNDIKELSKQIQLLLDDDERRHKYSEAAKREIRENGNIDKMCSGFKMALQHASSSFQIKKAFL